VIKISIINELIKEKGVTQVKVSEDTGINLSTIKGYCRGLAKPKLKKAKILGEYFGVAPSFLMGVENEGKVLSFNEINLILRQHFNEGIENAELQIPIFKLLDLSETLKRADNESNNEFFYKMLFEVWSLFIHTLANEQLDYSSHNDLSEAEIQLAKINSLAHKFFQEKKR